MFTPEFKLLLSSCKPFPGAKLTESAKSVFPEKLNEDHFIELVDRHAVAPLVNHYLRSTTKVSSQLSEVLKLRVEQNQLRSLSAMLMIVRLQKKLDADHINAIFLKGIPLAAMYYGDVALRQSMDIDLWVEKKGFNAIADYLTSLGYQSNLDLKKLNKKQVNYKFRTDHHLHFYTNDPSLPPFIELHWKIRDRFGLFTFNPELQHRQTIKYEIAGVEISVFDHIDNFLFLCTHGCEHAWYRLKWLFDLPQLMSKVNYDWGEVKKRALELNCLDQLQLSFLVLNKFLDYDIPVPIKPSKINYKMKTQLSYIEHCISYKGQYCDTDWEKMMNLNYFLSLNKKGFLNPGILLRYLTSENDWKVLPLPEKLFFLYFPLRPFLLIWRRLFR